MVAAVAQNTVSNIRRKVAEVGSADESGTVGTEHESESYKPEEQRTDHEVYEILEQDVRRVLTSGETGFAQGESRLHKEYQHGGKQHPDGIQ